MTSGDDWMGDALPEPTDPELAASPAWRAFASQFEAYSRGARTARVAHRVARVLALVLAAAVTVSAGLGAPPAVTAGLGAGIVVLEGLQQLFQWHVNWIAYRQATETMRQHAIDLLAGTGVYAGDGPAARLDRLSRLRRDVALSENRGWAGRMRRDDDG